jgi:hypothetical protein
LRCFRSAASCPPCRWSRANILGELVELADRVKLLEGRVTDLEEQVRDDD